MSVIKSYILKEQYGDIKPGTLLYAIQRRDYGLAAADSRVMSEPYVSVTHDDEGDYPFFTIPRRLLEDRVDTEG